MKSNIKSQFRTCRLIPFRRRYPLRSLASVLPHIPRQISYLEDLLGDG
ncbi:MAG: hypothetical protein ACFBSF_21165 [Leptolyngbyaceae cyanobacterium]